MPQKSQPYPSSGNQAGSRAAGRRESKLIQKLLLKLPPVTTIPQWVRYGATTAIVLLFFILRLYLQGLMAYSPYLIFIPAVILSALFFNRKSGCLAVILSSLLAYYFFVPPYHSFTHKSLMNLTGIGIYFVIGFLTALVLEALRDAVDELAKVAADQQLLVALVNDSDVAIVGKSLTGEIISWNSGAEKTFGYTAAEAIGKNIKLIIPPERFPEEDKILYEIRNGNRAEHLETERITKDGRRIDISVIISPVYDNKGNIVGASKIARDITLQKKAAAERDHYMREMEQANEKLRESNRQLDEFAHIISHDLKEPVRGIETYSSMLIEDCKDRMNPEDREKLDKIKNMCLRMNELISDLLKYSRVGKEAAPREEANLDDIINNILDLLRPQIKKESVQLSVAHPLPKVLCNKSHMAEILRNLITNGIKYNNSRPKRIAVGFIENHPRHAGLTFFVKDNGIGIPDEFKGAVFNMFKRLHAREQYGGGTGAGLAIVRKLVDLNNGDIWIEDNEGGGSAFYFYLGGS